MTKGRSVAFESSWRGKFMFGNWTTAMLTPPTHPYTVHGRSTLKDDWERFGDGPVREPKEKCKTCNKISKLYEASVSINDEQTMIAIDWTLHCELLYGKNNSDAVWKSSTKSFMCWPTSFPQVLIRIALLERKTLIETKNRTLKCLKWHSSIVRSTKNVAVLTKDGAFALFFRPHPGGFDSLRVSTPRKLGGPGLGTAGIDWCITFVWIFTRNMFSINHYVLINSTIFLPMVQYEEPIKNLISLICEKLPLNIRTCSAWPQKF